MSGQYPGGIRAPDGTLLFAHQELACRATGIVQLAPGFADRLVELRLAYGKAMPVTSCCRSARHNASVGGAPDSFHVYDQSRVAGGTAAIDIAVAGGAAARELVVVALGLGWSIGVPRAGFIHLDRRDLIGAPPVVFGY